MSDESHGRTTLPRDEPDAAKLQILNLAVKLTLKPATDDAADAADVSRAIEGDARVTQLLRYILELSRYDKNTDLRDRTRYYTALLGLAPAGLESPDETALLALRSKVGRERMK